ncbi:MAG: nucleotidyltransferase family protein [Coriobacteriia bacterium]|nr:nucleotidyltransferase family protein [Coriobacteriia bacterium]
MTQTKVDVVILAGGDGEVIDPSCRFKGLLPVNGKPLVEWVVEAFLDARLVNEIAVVMPTAENLGSWVDRVDKLVVSDRDFMDNVICGIGSFRADRRVLVATGDIPLLTGAGVDEFVTASLENGADFIYPLVRRDDLEAQFPGSDRTYFRLKTGWHTGGNAMIVNPLLVPRARDLGQRLFNDRKNPVAVVKTAGLGFVAKFVLGRLQPEDLSDKIRDLLGGSGAAVLTKDASIAIDVDKPSDLTLVERVLSERD